MAAFTGDAREGGVGGGHEPAESNGSNRANSPTFSARFEAVLLAAGQLAGRPPG